ncbi:MAG: hypothetical protein QXH27_02980 [Candidatus Micrarchaeia archaeon]
MKRRTSRAYIRYTRHPVRRALRRAARRVPAPAGAGALLKQLHSKLLLLRARASKTNRRMELEQIEVELSALGREVDRRGIEPLSNEVRLFREHLFHKIVGDGTVAYY